MLSSAQEHPARVSLIFKRNNSCSVCHALKFQTLFLAGFHEIVPAERLSLLTFQDLRMAILGELRIDACQWQQRAQYESPYSKVRVCSLCMVPCLGRMRFALHLRGLFNPDIACRIRR